MHKAWLKSISAASCVLGLSAASVFADPASMAMQRHPDQPAASSTSFWPWSKSAAAAPATPAVQPQSAWQHVESAPVYPSAEISPWKHPIKYFQASVAEMPIGKSNVAAHPVMPPAPTRTDPIALSVPTGPPSPEFFIFASQMCERQGDIPQARQNLTRALSMWPGNADVLRAAARMEDRQGNLQQAESLYQQAVASNPQNAAALNDLGLCLAREGRLEPSLQVLEQSVQLAPDKPLYRNNAATVLVEMRQDQRALAHLAAVHNLADANFNLGQLLVQRGRAADAAPYFQAALQQNPGMQQAQEALVKLQGNPVAVSAPVSQALMAPQQAPQVGPNFVPQQQGWQTGPQISYPATARTPAAGASSYVPSQYLPPTASLPGAMQR
jgi:tetratricopeptide (TPR) repeat protein